MRRFIVGLLATIGFLTLVFWIGVAAWLSTGPFASKPLPQPIVLELDLRSVPAETTVGSMLGLQGSRDIVDTIQLIWQAADDSRVKGMFVEIGDESAGLARVQELREAIARFRGKGKFAIGFAQSLGNGSHFADYYLASALDQIWLQPSGDFMVAGIAVETPFLRTALDKVGIQVEGGKRWQYKSAPDTFLETGYTAPARQNLDQLLNSLFDQFVADVSRERHLEPAKLRQLIDSVPLDAEHAEKEKLVDKLGYRADALDEAWKRSDNKTHDLTSLNDYAGDDSRPKPHGEVIGLVRVSGAISSGGASTGPLDDDNAANSEDVVDALDQAVKAKDVKAILLRIDSPGGTYPAADAIADAVGRARSAGKPVIVSMGDVAASGGYLAAVRGDVIVAEPTTNTASIGVFSIWPVASQLLTSLGVSVDRLKVGTNAGMYSPFQAPTEAQKAAVDRQLDTIYNAFTGEVSQFRKLDGEKLDAAARGRVFSGNDAKKAGLIDELGGLQLALNIAKAKAGIDEAKSIELRRYPPESERWQKIIDRVMRLFGVETDGTVRAPREVREALARFGIVAHPGNVRLPPLPPLWH